MGKLFDPNLVYPQDDMGEYIELVGEITKVGGVLGDSVSVTVKTDKGTFIGYWESPPSGKYFPKTGQWARIRCYNSGGGWYPDDKITGFGSREFVA